jgi:molecular chaperone IbpA
LDELDMVVKDNTLVVSGKVANDGQEGEVLYRGIAGRAFERRFVLADHIVVDGADLQNGLLHVGIPKWHINALVSHAGPGSASDSPIKPL